MASDTKDTRSSPFLTAGQTIAQNRRARFDYALSDTYEAGLILTGSEVKSLRRGHASINEAYVAPKGRTLVLLNATIEEYNQSGRHLQHEPKRARPLLLHKSQLVKCLEAIRREGYTIVPTRLYFNARNMVKIEIALAKGKKNQDKRETQKERDWNRQKQRLRQT